MAAPVVENVVMSGDQFAALIEAVTARVNPGGSLGTDELQQILETVSQSNAAAMQRSLEREDRNYIERGPFAWPDKRKLRRKTYFCYAEQRDDTLTEAEVDAYNAITRSCTARDGAWTATIVRDGTTEKLHVFVPGKTIDQRMELPSLLDILAELKDGPAAVDRTAMAERIAELEARLAKIDAKGSPGK